MNEYRERLIRCGIPAHEAEVIVRSFLKEYGIEGLEEFTASMEEDVYVA